MGETLPGQDAAQSVILMVDDTPANLGVLFELLSDSGFRVLVAEDGPSALTRAAYVKPDLILLDIMMPGMDGFEVCARLKQQAETAAIPVIFMTALSDTEDKVRGFELGAVDYIAKPFQDSEVLARVRTHLALQNLQRQLVASEERLSRIIASALDAIISVDQNGRITLFNPAAERVFQTTLDQVLRQPVQCLFDEELGKFFANYCQQAAPPITLPDGVHALRLDGGTFPIEGSLSSAELNGQPVYIFILRDLSEQTRNEAERRKLESLTLYLSEEIRAAHEIDDIIGESTALHQVMASVKQVAQTDATVLISGETGTGKEVIARAIHGASHLSERILVKLNCAAMPANLVESELFGHERGAFTGAVARKAGRFELANGGTLFLDEIGELPLDAQAKLLRILQEGEFERVGGTQTFKVNVRVIAATNRNLAQMAEQEKFRSDLYYRLNVFPIHLPPLRERKDDIVPLVKYFVARCASKFGKPIEIIPERVTRALLQYNWPGNIRELQHVIERAVILSQGPELVLGDWFQTTPTRPASGSNKLRTLAEMERDYILEILGQTYWRVSGKGGAAELLDLKPTTLESRMKKLGIVRPR